MSQFYSDFLSWTTAAMTGAAAMLAGVNLPSDPSSTTSDDVALASAAVPAPTLRAADVQQANLIPIAGPKLESDASPIADIDFASAAEPAGATGRVTGTTVNLRSGPGTGFPVGGQVHEGDRLSATGKRDGEWIEVKAPGTDVPLWIFGRFFEPLS